MLLFQSEAASLIAKFNLSHFKYYITLKVKDENLLNISSVAACVAVCRDIVDPVIDFFHLLFEALIVTLQASFFFPKK